MVYKRDLSQIIFRFNSRYQYKHYYHNIIYNVYHRRL